ncbi:hypothetical protein [Mesorhizobium sp.]|uniref:hypothetical protein n=1 Tax=Mesorhizobium sp. TaxID=1871066 RepID=UPI003455BD7A
MEAAGLESWPKVTGGKGIHLTAPLETKVTHDCHDNWPSRSPSASLMQILIVTCCPPHPRSEKAVS